MITEQQAHDWRARAEATLLDIVLHNHGGYSIAIMQGLRPDAVSHQPVGRALSLALAVVAGLSISKQPEAYLRESESLMADPVVARIVAKPEFPTGTPPDRLEKAVRECLITHARATWAVQFYLLTIPA